MPPARRHFSSEHPLDRDPSGHEVNDQPEHNQPEHSGAMVALRCSSPEVVPHTSARRGALNSMVKRKVSSFVRKPLVVATATATATVSAAVVAEVGMHLLTRGKLTPSRMLTRTATPLTRTPMVNTTVTEIITLSKKIHTIRS